MFVVRGVILLAVGLLEGVYNRCTIKGKLSWVRGVLAIEKAEQYLFQYHISCKTKAPKDIKTVIITEMLRLRDEGYIDMFDEVDLGPKKYTHGGTKRTIAPSQSTMVRLTTTKGASFFDLYVSHIRQSIN
jgi:hypothetical protein